MDFKALQETVSDLQSQVDHYRRKAGHVSPPRRGRSHAYVATELPTTYLGPDDPPELYAPAVDPDTIDPAYALSARARFNADAAHARVVRSDADDSASRQFFDLPDDDDY